MRVAGGTKRWARGSLSKYCGSTPMWKTVLDEAREIAWLAIVIGALSVASVSLAVVLAAA
jgi:hypothetical protein